MKKIGIISYHGVGHLKVLNIATDLVQKNYDISIFAFPFKKNKKKKKNKNTFQDRPDPILKNFDFQTFCKKNNIKYYKMSGWNMESLKLFNKNNKNKVYLHCIKKIIPENFIRGNIILNAHPGILPIARGIDSFKWTIINTFPIGVTLHKIDKHIDCGTVLKRSYIYIDKFDKLSDIVNKSFNLECFLLSNFEFYLKNLKKNEKIKNSSFYFSKKISTSDEKNIENIFKKKINNFKKKFEYYSKKETLK